MKVNFALEMYKYIGAERQQGQGWDAYYDCTKRKHEEGGPDDILYPTVLLILEGTSAKYIHNNAIYIYKIFYKELLYVYNFN